MVGICTGERYGRRCRSFSAVNVTRFVAILPLVCLSTTGDSSAVMSDNSRVSSRFAYLLSAEHVVRVAGHKDILYFVGVTVMFSFSVPQLAHDEDCRIVGAADYSVRALAGEERTRDD